MSLRTSSSYPKTKTGWPWRLGTSSYILPDDILPNVRYLADKVDDVELVLFESKEAGNLPTKAVVRELRELASAHGLTYTVHFPLDVYPGAADAAERSRTLETYKKIIGLTEGLSPFGYVLHLTPDMYGERPSADIPRWLDNLDRSLEVLLRTGLVESHMLCAETLSYPFELVLPLVERYDLAVTLDIGHVWLMGHDAAANCASLLGRARICHLHGVSGLAAEGGRDHQGLSATEPVKVESFLRALATRIRADRTHRVLTLEVFSQEHLENSLQVLEESRAIVL
ncbi:MAG: cobamide remodeling phosphodiesterase CbiR [Sphaerochaetaceae bacterium]|nr:cobamide remodeling phosphodiesterase CbiR [Sphaerochaetaceae bacterium]